MVEPTEPYATPLINARLCTGCGICAALCPTRAVEVQAGKAVIVRPAACTFCPICETYCPSGAIGRPFTIAFAPGPPAPAGKPVRA
jgi:ferredoxin